MLNFLDPALMPVMAAFVFVFAIVLGLLTSAAIFQRRVNTVIALVFAVFSASYSPLVLILQQYIPIAAILFIIIFIIVLVQKSVSKKNTDSVLSSISLLILLFILGVFWDEIQYILPVGLDPMNALGIIVVIVIVLIFLVAYKHGKNTPETK
jgi:hypothetical protein